MPNTCDNHALTGRGLSKPRLSLRSRLRGRNHTRARACPRAFTLVEIMIVLAIIAMGTGVMIIGVTKIFGDNPTRPVDVFWKSVNAARKQALQSGRDVRLAFAAAGSDANGEMPASLVATWENDGSKTFPFEKTRDVICEFLTTQKSVSSVVIAGEVVETQTLPYITFYGDGTCTPCRVQFRINGSPLILAIDPWTCAEMFPQKEDAP